MALVAYDYSDDSDDNEPVNISNTRKISEDGSIPREEISSPAPVNFELPPSMRSSAGFRGSKTEDDDDDSRSSNSDDDEPEPVDLSFSTLPKPQYDTLYVDESKLKASKSGLFKKLVSLPRVNKTTMTKKRGSSTRTSTEKATLLSLLPTPSGESTKKTVSTASNTTLLPTAVGNRIKAKQKPEKNENEDEDSDSDTDFFGLSKIDKEPEYDTSSIDLDMIVKPLNDTTVSKKPDVINEDASKISELSRYLGDNNLTNEGAASVSDMNVDLESQSRLHLDEDAVLKLCGRKRKGQVPDDIQVIDIHEDNVLAETRKNLTKRLTEEVSYRPIRSTGSSTLSKRKHQITYLAFQAKERELELKNQWADNRFNKKQTQSKYGF